MRDAAAATERALTGATGPGTRTTSPVQRRQHSTAPPRHRTAAPPIVLQPRRISSPRRRQLAADMRRVMAPAATSLSSASSSGLSGGCFPRHPQSGRPGLLTLPLSIGLLMRSSGPLGRPPLQRPRGAARPSIPRLRALHVPAPSPQHLPRPRLRSRTLRCAARCACSRLSSAASRAGAASCLLPGVPHLSTASDVGR